MNCVYCDKGEKLDELMIHICSLSQSDVYLVRNQNFPGRCVVAFKDHKTEIFQLTDEERNGFMHDVSITAKAIFDTYEPDKLNYGIYGDGVPHFHVHIIPKKKDGYCWGGTFDLNGNADYPSEEELKKRADMILSMIRRQQNA